MGTITVTSWIYPHMPRAIGRTFAVSVVKESALIQLRIYPKLYLAAPD